MSSSQDKKDFIATHLVHLANTLSVTSFRLTIAYLLIHGLVKVFLVVMLLRRRLWAYPTAIAVFTAFGAYQVYQYTYSHSLFLLGLTRPGRGRHRAHGLGVSDTCRPGSCGRRGGRLRR